MAHLMDLWLAHMKDLQMERKRVCYLELAMDSLTELWKVHSMANLKVLYLVLEMEQSLDKLMDY